MIIQAILFDKRKWTTTEAREWLKKHNYYPIKKVHVTEHFLRYRIESPDSFSRFVTKHISDGIELILGIK